MENESGKKKETDDPTPRRRSRKDGLKFALKVSPKGTPKITPKTEPHDENKGVAVDKELLIKLRTPQSTGVLRGRAKDEKQETRVQVAFGQADPSIPRTFPTRSSSSGVSAGKSEKEHNEPWDYTCTNYPITLPLRRPFSGDPDEFGLSSSRAQDGELTAAEELGLMARVDEPQLLFFQFPASLPLPRQASPVAETDLNAKSKGNTRKRPHGYKLKDLPGGHMGKILVYNSGKVKMTLGKVLFDVSAGSDCSFAQEAVAIDTKEKRCCGLGEVGRCAIVTPDVDSLLDCIKME